MFDAALAAYEKALELRPDPEWIEPYPRMAFIYAKQVKEYMSRLRVAGLDRTSRITIPLEIPDLGLAA